MLTKPISLKKQTKGSSLNLSNSSKNKKNPRIANIIPNYVTNYKVAQIKTHGSPALNINNNKLFKIFNKKCSNFSIVNKKSP